MKLLGKVLHSVKSGYIVVAINDPDSVPPLGVPVYTTDYRRVGVVLDVIGPVDSPYAVVKPDRKELLEAVKEGQWLYYEPPKPKRPPRRRKGKQRRKSKAK